MTVAIITIRKLLAALERIRDSAPTRLPTANTAPRCAGPDRRDGGRRDRGRQGGSMNEYEMRVEARRQRLRGPT